MDQQFPSGLSLANMKDSDDLPLQDPTVTAPLDGDVDFESQSEPEDSYMDSVSPGPESAASGLHETSNEDRRNADEQSEYWLFISQNDKGF